MVREWVDPIPVAAPRASAALPIGWRIWISIARSQVTGVLTNAATWERSYREFERPLEARRLAEDDPKPPRLAVWGFPSTPPRAKGPPPLSLGQSESASAGLGNPPPNNTIKP